MNTFFKFLKNIFVWIFKDWKHVVIVFSLIALIILSFKYKNLKNDFNDIQNTAQDTLIKYKNKVGELYSQQKTYITEIKDLKKSNSELYTEVKNLKDNPVVVTKVHTVTEFKDKIIKDTVNVDPSGNYTFNMNYKDQWVNLSGRSTFDISTMIGTAKFDSISFPNTITIDLIEKNNQLSFIAKSDNPYCKINSLNGSILSPEKSSVIKKRFDKKWAVVIGVGPTISVYDSKIVVLPGLQVTIGRKLFAF
jgi:hypothetical protein